MKQRTRIFDFYLFRHLLIATVFVAVTLSCVIFLTQSLRFLELVIASGASSGSFFLLTMLALPRFFEIIVPLALMAGTVFVYNRMTADSELTAMRAMGASPAALARPALALALLTTVFLWMMTMWVAPSSLAGMQHMRQVIKAQVSNLLFREGVFNSVLPGLTVYIRERNKAGEMLGLMIHDGRDNSKPPATILAKKGVVAVTDAGHQVFVYDGARQEMDPKTGALRNLNFERYTIDLPENTAVRQRWREPDERTIGELLHPDMNNARDRESLNEFKLEIHRRLVSPLLAPVFAVLSLCALLLGPADRRGQARRIAIAAGSVVLVQGLYLAAFNLSRQNDWGLVLLYLLVIAPLAGGGFALSGASESLRRKLLYRPRPETEKAA